jgi:hypothetical protein
MNMIMKIGAAILLLSIFSNPLKAKSLQTQKVGPFVIESEVTDPIGSPYPRVWKVVRLKWILSETDLGFKIEDNGESIRFNYSLNSKQGPCLFIGDPISFDYNVVAVFNSKPWEKSSCFSSMSDTDRLRIEKGFKRAKNVFPKAYRKFQTASLSLNGKEKRRCKEYGFGNHGPICFSYFEKI